MNNSKTNTIFGQNHTSKLSNNFWLNYLRRGFGLFILLLCLFTLSIGNNYIKSAREIQSIYKFPVTASVAINYINPLYRDTSKILAGEFLAANYPQYVKKDILISYKLYKNSIDEVTQNQLQDLAAEVKRRSILDLLISLLISISLTYYLYERDSEKSKKELHKRGMILQTSDEMIRATKNTHNVLSIGHIHISSAIETKHILVFGSTGSGKSVLLSQFLHQIISYSRKYADKRHFILTDVKPEFVGKFAENDDFIFCPFDKRSVYWSIFEDVEDLSDYDTFASILFHNPKAKDPYWDTAAATIFADGLKYLDLNNQRTNRDILLFFQQSVKDIANKLKTLPMGLQKSKQHIEGADNTVSSVLSTLATGLKPFEYLKDPQSGEPLFSFKKYIREEYKRNNGTIPNLYLVVPTNRQALMAPLLSLAMDIMISETLTLPESKTCRLYFIIDEIGSVNKIKMLPDLITKGRSYGVSIIALTQDPGLMKEKYGTSTMQSFLNNFGTQIILRINDSNTAKELSDMLGVEERIEYKNSLQMQNNGQMVPSVSKEIVSKPLVIASELQSLPDFKGFGKMIGCNPFMLEIPKYFFDKKSGMEHFVPIDNITIDTYRKPSTPQNIDIKSTENFLKQLKGDK